MVLFGSAGEERATVTVLMHKRAGTEVRLDCVPVRFLVGGLAWVVQRGLLFAYVVANGAGSS